MTRLDKRNRENQVASAIVGLFTGSFHPGTVTGIKVANVRYHDKGCSVDLEDGSTISIRITAHAPE